MNHSLLDSETCRCGEDTVLCQITGKVVCGSMTIWVNGVGNVLVTEAWKLGLGHAGGK